MLPFKVGDTVYTYRAVVADIDCAMIIGADFMQEYQVQINFTRKGANVTIGLSKSTFSLRVVKKFMAQWVKTKVTECIQPGEESFIGVRMTNYSHHTRPSPGEGGLLEPSTTIRACGALVPYTYMAAREILVVTVINTGDEPLWLNAGTIIRHWSPANIITINPLDDECKLNTHESVEDSFETSVSRMDQIVRRQ